MGQQLRMFFEDEKAALLQQIDAEFEKVWIKIRNSVELCVKCTDFKYIWVVLKIKDYQYTPKNYNIVV